jgi:WD40 repeat protein
LGNTVSSAAENPMLILPGHKNRVCALAYSPNGALLASGGGDKKVRLWDLVTSRERATLRGHPACIYAAAFSPDGATLVTGGGQNTLRLWDVATGQSRSLDGHTVLVAAAVFSPEGNIVASAAGNVFDSNFPGEVSIWDAKSGRFVKTAPVIGGAWALAFAPNGETLAVGSGAQQVTFWDRSLRSSPPLEQAAAVRCVAFSPNGQTLAVAAGWDVKLWDVQTRRCLHTLKGHRGFVWALAFSPIGRMLFSGSEDQTVRVWDVASGRQRSAFDWQVGKVRALAASPDGMTVAAGGENEIVLWDNDDA